MGKPIQRATEKINVRSEDIVLKNKGNQNAGNPQNHVPQGQMKK